MSKKADHIHKYQRVNIGTTKDYTVYRCMIDNCNHYLQPVLVINKETQCWGDCGGTLIITHEMASREIMKPTCRPCIEQRKERIALASVTKDESE